MGKNHKEKEQAKFYKGLISSVSENLKNKWKRLNGAKGEFRALRKEKLENILNKELARNPIYASDELDELRL